jgi:hypothetical protein
MVEPLASWTDGAAKAAIVEFVEGVTTPGSDDHVPPAERVAVFDNDGTLWCEKPMPIQLDFIVRRLAEMAQAQPELYERQPRKAPPSATSPGLEQQWRSSTRGTTPM